MLPMTDHEYGCSRGYVFGGMNLPRLTVRAIEALALLVLDDAALLVEALLRDRPSKWPMRSDSIQSATSSAEVGTVWK